MNVCSLEQKVQQLILSDLEIRESLVTEIIELIFSPETASKAIVLVKDYLENTLRGQELGDIGTYINVSDPELVVSLLEILQHCFQEGGDLFDLILLITQIHYLDRKESTKSKTELYLQYRATAILDTLLAQEIRFSKEVITTILASGNKYLSDHATKEFSCSIYWRLADQGVNISSVIGSLVTIFHNRETDELVQNSLLAIWAAVRNGCFETKIPDSDKTYELWLSHFIANATYKLKKKDEVNNLGIIGCLIAIANKYPNTKSIAIEYLEKCKIREPKRVTTDFQRDLRDYFILCRD